MQECGHVRIMNVDTQRHRNVEIGNVEMYKFIIKYK